MRSVIWLAIALAAAHVGTAQVGEQQPDAAAEAAAFEAFVREIRAAAAERGIGNATLDAVLPSIRLHRQAVEADRSQAEFVQTTKPTCAA